MTTYQHDMTSVQTVNGVAAEMQIDGHYAMAEYVVGYDYWLKSQDRVYIVIESARRKLAEFLTPVCAVYFSNGSRFILSPDGTMIHAGSEREAFQMAQAMANAMYLTTHAA